MIRGSRLQSTGLAWLGLTAMIALATETIAQDASSTLARLSDRSDVVAAVRVLHSSSDASGHRVVCKVQSTLRGELDGTFTLREGAGRLCGQALHGVAVGVSYLAFLDTTAGDPRLFVSSARALVRLDPIVLGHVKDLLKPQNQAGPKRLALLTAALDSKSLRVRTDAALSLPRTDSIRFAGVADRQRIVKALRSSLDRRDDQAAFALIRTSEHLGLRDAVDVLLPHYLSDRSGRLAAVALDSIPRLDGARAAHSLAKNMPKGIDGQKRAIALLGRCSGQRATDCLRALKKSRSPRVAELAGRALAAHESARATNTTTSPSSHQATPDMPQFRSIRLGRRSRDRVQRGLRK